MNQYPLKGPVEGLLYKKNYEFYPIGINMASMEGQGQVTVTVHGQENVGIKKSHLTPGELENNNTMQGHINLALEEDEILSPHKIELEELNVENDEIKTINAIIDPSPHNSENLEGRQHYKQNNAVFNSISPRAAKYREGTKAKLNKMITVPGGSTWGPQSSQSKPSRPTSQMGSLRGLPDNLGTKNLSGTIRSHHSLGGATVHSQQSVHSSIPLHVRRPINGTIKGYPSGTLSKGSVVFRRSYQPKEHLVKRFDIELDQHERHRYHPGEEISGKIIFDIQGKLEIRFIEFLVTGHSAITLFRNANLGKTKTFRDVFLNKRNYIVGTPDGKWTSLVTPGHYVSKFKFLLPSNIPSSMKYKDEHNGFGAEIVYTVKARICDDIGSSSARSTHSLNNLVKIILSRKNSFTVRRRFDIHSIPNALLPVIHQEDITLSSCSFFSSDIASVNLCIDRSCFLAGDDIQVRLEVENQYAKRIKMIDGCLQQKITLVKPKSHFIFDLSTFGVKEPKGTVITNKLRQTLACFDITLPTQMNILPSINPGCRLIQVTYNLRIVVHFSTCGGQLLLEMPVNIGPCSDPVNLEKRNSVPLFNRPKRFPHFSPHPNGHIQNGQAGIHLEPRSPVRVHTKFSHSAPSLLCCSADAAL
ncbi:uncharacterized protein LOC133196299 [Saccostrea echinata]|uniref:uncharacterized protein LOC133196299 n=1 Tax=Saccostrea echinata TaxID=191078 RepID=UPI002A816BA0|nr:uncharacterized protein LOC133196299 [Saccostrea echinata]